MKVVCADLHIHTCLSPCADREMSPAAVARESKQRGLDLIAICDHNTAENVEAVRQAAKNTGLAVVGGIEISTKEEVHMLGIFEDEQALAMAQKIVYQNLGGENDPGTFGEQLVMNEQGEVIRANNRLLIGATGLSLEETVCVIHRFDGLVIAAHVDRPSFSIISQIGFIPGTLALDGVEICSDVPWGVPDNLAVVRSSDAHRLGEIGSRRTRFLVEKPTVSEIGMALRRTNGRKILPVIERN